MRSVVMLLLASNDNCAQVVIGTKSGEMQIFDLSSSTLVETIKAHTGTLWSMHVRPDEQALVTGGADKDVKFWNIEWRQSDHESVSPSPCSDSVSSGLCMTFPLGQESYISGPRPDPQNDRRHLVGSLQPKRKTSRSRTP